MPYKDPAKGREQAKRWRDNNREKYRIIQNNWSAKNREKKRKSAREWTYRNPDKVRDSYFRRKFAISLDDYNSILASQNGVCKICEKAQDYKNLAVDHDHKTGKVRGLLCEDCNRGLGMFRDDLILMNKAINYLNNAI